MMTNANADRRPATMADAVSRAAHFATFRPAALVAGQQVQVYGRMLTVVADEQLAGWEQWAQPVTRATASDGVRTYARDVYFCGNGWRSRWFRM